MPEPELLPAPPKEPPAATGIAHGRVNLMGDHTDYNGGHVLPIGIPRRTRVQLWKRADRRASVQSAEMRGDSAEFALDLPERTGRWVDYVQGAVYALSREGFTVGGFDARVDSSVPVGSGLSSSAALDVALLRALRALFHLPIDDVQIAKIARAAETDFVGAPVGIMDPMAASVGDENAALFLDTRSLKFAAVPLPEGAELLVLDSGIRHSHATGDYSVRRGECEEAARLLGQQFLTDLVFPADELRVASLPAALARRARHVVTEDARVSALVSAFASGDLELCGSIFRASHASLRDDFAVSVPAIDALVEATCADEAVFGARLTGGGFGGCIVALVRAGAAMEAGERVQHELRRRGVPEPRILLPLGAPRSP
jgi:galactokinase